MAGNKDIQRFKRDAKEFGISAAGHIPYFGEALGIYDTVQKGRRLSKSTPRAINALKRRAKSNIKRRLRRYL
jgi:NAD-dependent SIR2 family protein deacetylase